MSSSKFQNLNEKPITLILMAVGIWKWSHFFLKGSANILKYQSHNWQLSFSFQEKNNWLTTGVMKYKSIFLSLLFVIFDFYGYS